MQQMQKRRVQEPVSELLTWEGVQWSSPLSDVDEYVTNGAIKRSSDVSSHTMDHAIPPGPEQRDSGSGREGAGVNVQLKHSEGCQSQT